MKNKCAETIVTRPLQELFDKNIIQEGQPLFFHYHSDSGNEVTYQGVLRKQGIEIDGNIYSPSYSAVYCIAKTGDRKAVNGWLMWKNKDGKYMAELYAQSKNIKLFPGSLENYTEKLYKYPEQRDVVFILGAGTSYAGGAPLQKTILPIILSGHHEELRNSHAFYHLKEFMTENFAWDHDSGYYPSLESVFGFIDYFIHQNEALNKKYSLASIRDIREVLIKSIHFVIDRETKERNNLHYLFWNTIYKHNRNIAIITTNYDTVLESAFECIYPFNAYIDYCIPLMNYDYNEGLGLSNWWINPREPIHSWMDEDPIAIKVIKVHGGLNWKYCSCCNQVLLTPLDTDVDIDGCEINRSKDFHNTGSKPTSFHHGCPCCESEFRTFLIPPSYSKNLSHPVYSNLIAEASKELRKCNRIVFVGYSLPEADVHIKAILKKSLSPDKEIIVVDTNDSSHFKYKYRELSDNVKFIKASFEEMVNNETVIKSLITLN
jgi:NAD-dependent SIR2 family protein deacetylase